MHYYSYVKFGKQIFYRIVNLFRILFCALNLEIPVYGSTPRMWHPDFGEGYSTNPEISRNLTRGQQLIRPQAREYRVQKCSQFVRPKLAFIVIIGAMQLAKTLKQQINFLR